MVKDILVYHNPDSMGYPASDVKEPVIVTNKRVGRETIGDRIWLITGEGQPRRYFLRGVFTVNKIESGEDEGFRTRVWGNEARFFRPMVELSDTKWFPDLRRSQGNFAFGFQVMNVPRFVRGLEKAASSSSKR